MIYLSDPKILFLKPRKVAGTSFEIALSRFAGPNDIITPITRTDEAARRERGFRGAQNFKGGLSEFLNDRKSRRRFAKKLEWPRRYRNHIPAADVRRHLGAEAFDAAFKISIVRNPFDTVVSKFYWSNRNKPEGADFSAWISGPEIFRVLEHNEEQYFIDGRDIIDFYIRYEHFAEDIAALEAARPELSGLAETFAGTRAKGGHRPKKASPAEMFAPHPDRVAAIRDRFAWMFEKFGYPDTP
ncbi:sulfotransferase family protein [Maritalea mobilis]|uniref:sulfotransferase family 2 domain-containing protein n=1 Tax=Maritalea mobilis TaxID=483324 RepID=UPI001C98016F|nr:sulfotransferase family 2 domain-containing protein [Maritalea mobilis]MBY6202708.1 sulfotransferase family protein [Maritalea mobilis]